MENTPVHSNPATEPAPPKSRLLIYTALLAVVITALLLLQTQRQFQQLQQQHIELLGQSLSRQLALTSVPLLLSQDWVSLSFSLKQASEDAYIAGIEVTNLRGETLAQIGTESAFRFSQPLASSDNKLGNLQLFIDRHALEQAVSPTSKQLYLMLILAIGALSGGFWGIYGWLQKQARARQHLEIQAAAAQTSLNTEQTGLATEQTNLAAEQTQPEVKQKSIDMLASQWVDIKQEPGFEPTIGEDLNPPETDILQADLGSAPPASADADPQTQDPQTQDLQKKQATDDENVEQVSATTFPTTNANPEEEPLETFLLYVNQQRAGSYLDDEKQLLLPHYQQFFQLAIRLYKGEQREDAQGNWYALFSQNQDTGGQVPTGVNALCAAQLFKGLYRRFNQQRIQQLQPVLNLKMALLGGSNELTLALHGHQLTALLESNELITHQRLFEQQELYQQLLKAGDYERLDQQTYLISNLSEGFQSLIDRQAEHFLEQKISSRRALRGA